MPTEFGDLSESKQFLKERFRHPFWTAFLLSWCLLNWQLFVVALFESEQMSVQFVLDHAQGVFWDWWLLWLLVIGLTNALLGRSIKELLTSGTIRIYNKTKLVHEKWHDDTVVPKTEFTELKNTADSCQAELAKSDAERKRLASILKDCESELSNINRVAQDAQSELGSILEGLVSKLGMDMKRGDSIRVHAQTYQDYALRMKQHPFFAEDIIKDNDSQ